jgi:dihydrofolate reductase
MSVSIIAALSDNNVIGRDNALPWHLSADLKRFKALTMGHTIVMGRKTFQSIGRVLPGRRTIVVTRGDFHADGVDVVHTLQEALVDDAFICGGAEVYAAALPRAQRMYLTRVHADVDGDAFFPEFDDVTEWQLVDTEHCEADDKNEYPYSFLTYEKKGEEASGREGE